jgi:crotonobetainyl-CoA:carnitine CoA-transferase CaiB-like acyl-CoA transferase
VVELTQYIAGPATSAILAELGADVIKVEPPTGEPMRRSSSVLFAALNRSKSSFAVDLKHARGAEIYLRLADTADVVLDNLLPRTLERLGIAPDTLLARNPRLVYCEVRGFLPGPSGDRPLFDTAAQLMSGLSYMTGPPGEPVHSGAPIIDLSSAIWAALAIVAAVAERNLTGRGRRLDVGLFETATYFTTSHIATASMTGVAPDPSPTRTAGGGSAAGVSRLFTTRDGRRVLIMVVSNPQWERFCMEFGFHELWADPELRTRAGRVARSAELHARIAELVVTQRAEDVLAHLEGADLPHAPLYTPLDVLTDRHLVESGGLMEVPYGDGAFIMPRLPFRAAGVEPAMPRGAPELGDRSRALLGELGFGEGEVADLIETGAVAACAGPRDGVR